MDPLLVTQSILDILTNLNLKFLVGGSVASSLYGEPRFTQDTDIEIWPDRTQIEALLAATETDFYAPKEAAFEALRRRSSFSLVHFESQYKIDLFVSKNRPFDRARAERRRIPDGFPANFWVSSPEDMVLIKLAVLATRKDQLCFDYLYHWASELQVEDLLKRALEQVQPL